MKTGAVVDAGRMASHWASGHNAVVAGAAGGFDGTGGAPVTLDVRVAVAGGVVTV